MSQTHLKSKAIAGSDRDDLGIAIADLSPTELVTHLDARIDELMGEITRSPVWTTVVDPATPAEQVREILKEIYLEIAMYQPDSIETIRRLATIAASMASTVSSGRAFARSS